MKRILLLTFICLGTNLIGQNDRFFETIDSLFQYRQFQTATDLLHEFIDEHHGRYYDHAKAYLLISHIDLELGNFDEALARNQMSMELRERLQTDDVAENFMQLGAIRIEQRDYDQALMELYKAKDLPLEDPQLFSQINNYMAIAFKEKKEYDHALECLEESLTLLQIDLGENHPDVGTTYIQIGELYRSQEKLAEGEFYFKKALEIMLKNPDSYLFKAFPNSFIVPLLQRFFSK